MSASALFFGKDNAMKNPIAKGYFTKTELILWSVSSSCIIIAFFIFGGSDILSLTASLIGVTSILFSAKGNPAGPLLMIVFSLLYGYISFSFSYYGEMITYLGMTMPMSIFALAAWLRNPYNGNRSKVRIGQISCRGEIIVILLIAGAVTVLFFFILKAFNTANLIPSTLSVTTSFIAVFLTYRRISLFALAYAANDLVLIILWGLACTEDSHYFSVLVCFCAFLVNDIYCFISWRKRKSLQIKAAE